MFKTIKNLILYLFSFLSESYIAMAVLHLIENEKSVVEGVGATGLAAAFSGQLDKLKGKRLDLFVKVIINQCKPIDWFLWGDRV